VERIVGSFVIPDVRDAVSRARRTPATCLYCPEAPASTEHVLPDAIGGRLTAKILCGVHNRMAGVKSDEPLAVQFAPLVHMLGIVRSRGGKGTSFRGRSDDGEPLVMEADGEVRRHRRLQVKRLAPSGKIRYASGELRKLEELKKANAFEDPSLHILETMQRSPSINFEIAIARDVEPGVFKIALHFIAGFVTDVDAKVAVQLLPYITGESIVGGKYVRSLTLEGRYFPESWPPRHEIRSYPSGEETFVTVLVFGLHGFQVRLPIRTQHALRYVQPIIDSSAPILEPNTHVRDFGWDDRLTKVEWEAHQSNLRWRHEKFFWIARHRSTSEICRVASERATKSVFTYRITLLEAYRAELQVLAFSPEDISRLMWLARKMLERGLLPWQFSIDDFVF
jgi:hypothetical protein